jgi:hypothetical protein
LSQISKKIEAIRAEKATSQSFLRSTATTAHHSEIPGCNSQMTVLQGSISKVLQQHVIRNPESPCGSDRSRHQEKVENSQRASHFEKLTVIRRRPARRRNDRHQERE